MDFRDTEHVMPFADDAPAVRGQSIGRLLQGRNRLSSAQIQEILEHQSATGLRFGEAAVSLKLASHDDVVWALSQQFHYPYSPGRYTRNAELVVAADPFGEKAEAFRVLRSSLTLSLLSDEQARKSLAIVSADTRDGRTYVAANIAVAFSQLGRKTLLIDADMRNPRAHSCFGVPNSVGLSGLLSGSSADRSVIHAAPDLPGLYVLPVGALPPNPLELVERPGFSLLLSELMTKFDQVVIDTPAMVYGADARVIAARCGVVLTVARKGKTRQKSLSTLFRWLDDGSKKLAGVVINDYGW